MIYRSGNTVIRDGFALTFPENAFPDSRIQIAVSDMEQNMKELYDESTMGHGAMSMTDIVLNNYTFIVENDPLETPNISYTFKMPIPNSILNQCPDDYGYEIFKYAEQQELDERLYPLFILIESVYNETEQSLTGTVYPEIWINKIAQFVISCTPGPNRRSRRLLSGNCKAGALSSPLQSQRNVLRGFSRSHVGVGYAADGQYILAVSNGSIIKSGDSMFYGPRVIQKHDDGTYLHFNLLLYIYIYIYI